MIDKHTPDPFLTTLGLARRAGKLILGWDRIDEYSGHISFCVVANDASERTVLNAKKEPKRFLLIILWIFSVPLSALKERLSLL